MQPSRSRGRKPYDHPGRYSPRQGVDEPGSHQNSPSRRRGVFGTQDKSTMGDATSRFYPPQSSGGLPNTEAHPPSKVIQWLDYFSVEDGRMKKYNPVTGETCDATGSTELSQTDTKAFSPGKGFALDVGRVRESAERPSTSGKLVGGDARVKTPHDNNQPSRDKPLRSSDGPPTGASTTPSSLSTSHTLNKAAVQSRSLPTSADEMDRPVTVRDMKQFTETIQATMREIGVEFIKAIADLHQQEGGSEGDGEDEPQ